MRNCAMSMDQIQEYRCPLSPVGEAPLSPAYTASKWRSRAAFPSLRFYAHVGVSHRERGWWKHKKNPLICKKAFMFRVFFYVRNELICKDICWISHVTQRCCQGDCSFSTFSVTLRIIFKPNLVQFICPSLSVKTQLLHKLSKDSRQLKGPVVCPSLGV